MEDKIVYTQKLLELLEKRHEKDPGLFVNKSTISIELEISEEEAFRYADYLVNNKWAKISEPDSSRWRIGITDDGKKEMIRLKKIILEAKGFEELDKRKKKLSNSAKSENKLNKTTSPKEVLRSHLKELKKAKENKDATLVQRIGERILEYSQRLNLTYVEFNQLRDELIPLINMAFGQRRTKLLSTDPKHIEKLFDEYIIPHIDIVTSLVESLIELPKEINMKKHVPIEKKPSFLKSIFSNVKTSKTSPESHFPSDFDDADLLDIDKLSKNQENIDVFVSHRFIKSDVELAKILENLLEKSDLIPYLAERQREYGKHLSDKIKEKIEKSKCLIAIITGNSMYAPSIHQEIGYALGFRTPVIILAEQDEAPGILVKGVEIEPFKRINFEKHCKVVLQHIPKNRKPREISDENKKMLKEEVYIPLYNMMKKFDSKPVDLTVLPPNTFESLEPHQILTIEDDIKKLLDEYDSELEIWKKMFIEINEGFETNKRTLGKILEPAFSQEELLDANGMIKLGESTSQEPQHWIEANKIIIFDNTIPMNDGPTLLSKLKEHTRRTNPEGMKYLKFWEEVAPSIFHVLTTYLPELWRALRIEEITHSNLIKQRDNLSSKISNLVSVLEKKIKN